MGFEAGRGERERGREGDEGTKGRRDGETKGLRDEETEELWRARDSPPGRGWGWVLKKEEQKGR